MLESGSSAEFRSLSSEDEEVSREEPHAKSRLWDALYRQRPFSFALDFGEKPAAQQPDCRLLSCAVEQRRGLLGAERLLVAYIATSDARLTISKSAAEVRGLLDCFRARLPFVLVPQCPAAAPVGIPEDLWARELPLAVEAFFLRLLSSSAVRETNLLELLAAPSRSSTLAAGLARLKVSVGWAAAPPPPGEQRPEELREFAALRRLAQALACRIRARQRQQQALEELSAAYAAFESQAQGDGVLCLRTDAFAELSALLLRAELLVADVESVQLSLGAFFGEKDPRSGEEAPGIARRKESFLIEQVQLAVKSFEGRAAEIIELALAEFGKSVFD